MGHKMLKSCVCVCLCSCIAVFMRTNVIIIIIPSLGCLFITCLFEGLMSNQVAVKEISTGSVTKIEVKCECLCVISEVQVLSFFLANIRFLGNPDRKQEA